MIAKTFSATVLGIEAHLIEVEVDVSVGLSARAYDCILKVARTIAALAESVNVETQHVAEAVQFRNLDRPV